MAIDATTMLGKFVVQKTLSIIWDGIEEEFRQYQDDKSLEITNVGNMIDSLGVSYKLPDGVTPIREILHTAPVFSVVRLNDEEGLTVEEHFAPHYVKSRYSTQMDAVMSVYRNAMFGPLDDIHPDTIKKKHK